MKDKLLVLFEEDKEYLNQFINYFENYQDAQLKIMGFSNREIFTEFMNKNHIDFILTDEENVNKICSGFNKDNIIIFTEKAEIESINGIRAVYKYQKVDSIIRYIINLYADLLVDMKSVVKTKNGESTKIIGVYSPIKRCGKTMLSMELADHLSKVGKVLLMNMEEYSSLGINGGNTVYDLADLLYFYMQYSWSFELKLKAVLQRLHGFDYIPPIRNGDELKSIAVEQWRGLITEVARISDYKIIILDISDIVCNILQLFDMCDYIVIPYLTDEISNGKMEEFEKELSLKEEKNNLQIFRLSMDEVFNESFDNERLKYNVNVLFDKGGFNTIDGGKR